LWTGTQLLVWQASDDPARQGFAYDPATDTWETIPGAPLSPRTGHVAVWTGKYMLIWGGRNGAGLLADGALYDPVTRLWVSTPVSPPFSPTPRANATAIWTGNEVLIYGGETATPGPTTTGALLEPELGRWRGMSTVGAPPLGRREENRAAVWTGSHFLVWHPDGGARYEPDLNLWTPIATAGQPERRRSHSAVWTGTELLIWGGVFYDPFFQDGAAYNPMTDTWRALATAGAPSARENALAVWTGHEMVVWSGTFGIASTWVQDGAMYDPTRDSWRPMSAAGAPEYGRTRVEMVWSGQAVHFFGGYNGDLNAGSGVVFNTLETFYPRGIDALFGDGFDL
jgi:hypothetical protein